MNTTPKTQCVSLMLTLSAVVVRVRVVLATVASPDVMVAEAAVCQDALRG